MSWLAACSVVAPRHCSIADCCMTGLVRAARSIAAVDDEATFEMLCVTYNLFTSFCLA
jgi:hypothetical protein